MTAIKLPRYELLTGPLAGEIVDDSGIYLQDRGIDTLLKAAVNDPDMVRYYMDWASTKGKLLCEDTYEEYILSWDSKEIE